MSEKRYFAGWWFFILLMVVLSVPVLWGLNSAGLIFSKKVERAVLVNSHQYIEGMAQRGAVMRANLAEAQALLANETNEEARANIQTQISVLKAQLSAITRIQE